MTDQAKPKAPERLEVVGRALWRRVTAEFEGFNPLEAVLLEHACKTIDLCHRLAAVIAEQGIIVEGSKGQPVTHPAIAELRLQRKLAADLFRQLGLPDPEELTAAKAREWKARRAARARWS